MLKVGQSPEARCRVDRKIMLLLIQWLIVPLIKNTCTCKYDKTGTCTTIHWFINTKTIEAVITLKQGTEWLLIRLQKIGALF